MRRVAPPQYICIVGAFTRAKSRALADFATAYSIYNSRSLCIPSRDFARRRWVQRFPSFLLQGRSLVKLKGGGFNVFGRLIVEVYMCIFDGVVL